MWNIIITLLLAHCMSYKGGTVCIDGMVLLSCFQGLLFGSGSCSCWSSLQCVFFGFHCTSTAYDLCIRPRRWQDFGHRSEGYLKIRLSRATNSPFKIEAFVELFRLHLASFLFFTGSYESCHSPYVLCHKLVTLHRIMPGTLCHLRQYSLVSLQNQYF